MIWREVLRVTIPGPPVPKGRPRFAKGRTYTDKKTVAYEKLVALCVSTAKELRGSRRPLCGDGPVRVDIVAIWPRPQRLMAARFPDGLIPKHTRPDIDNICKSTYDGIGRANRLIWNDDGQIQCHRSEKYYAERDQGPRLELALFVPTE